MYIYRVRAGRGTPHPAPAPFYLTGYPRPRPGRVIRVPQRIGSNYHPYQHLVNTRLIPGQTRYPFCTRLPDPVTTPIYDFFATIYI